MIIATLTGHNANIPMGFFKSLSQANGYTFIHQEGPSIPTNRNLVFERARFEGDNLLFIDSDMVFKREDLRIIEKHLEDKDIVSGLCVMSFPGYPPAIFDKDLKPYEEIPKETFEVNACGAAFLGISKRVLDTLTEPFTPILNEKYGQYYGEDVSFCMKAREAGFKIYCDPNLSIGHIKTEVKYYGK